MTDLQWAWERTYSREHSVECDCGEAQDGEYRLYAVVHYVDFGYYAVEIDVCRPQRNLTTNHLLKVSQTESNALSARQLAQHLGATLLSLLKQWDTQGNPQEAIAARDDLLYCAGKRRALLELASYMIKEVHSLGQLPGADDALQKAVQWQGETVRLEAERQEAIQALRELCEAYGDNDWPDNLHLRDILQKHLLSNIDIHPAQEP